MAAFLFVPTSRSLVLFLFIMAFIVSLCFWNPGNLCRDRRRRSARHAKVLPLSVLDSCVQDMYKCRGKNNFTPRTRAAVLSAMYTDAHRRRIHAHSAWFAGVGGISLRRYAAILAIEKVSAMPRDVMMGVLDLANLGSKKQYLARCRAQIQSSMLYRSEMPQILKAIESPRDDTSL
jgi:hypothetical protein